MYTFSNAQKRNLHSAHMCTSARVQLCMFSLAHLYICTFCNMSIFNLGHPRSGLSLLPDTCAYVHLHTCTLVRMLIFTILHMCYFSFLHVCTCACAHFCNTPIGSVLNI